MSRYEYMHDPQLRRRFALFRSTGAMAIAMAIAVTAACLQPEETASTRPVATLPPMASADTVLTYSPEARVEDLIVPGWY